MRLEGEWSALLLAAQAWPAQIVPLSPRASEPAAASASASLHLSGESHVHFLATAAPPHQADTNGIVGIVTDLSAAWSALPTPAGTSSQVSEESHEGAATLPATSDPPGSSANDAPPPHRRQRRVIYSGWGRVESDTPSVVKAAQYMEAGATAPVTFQVVFTNPVTIVARAPTAFVDVRFRAPVRVLGPGPVFFIRCFFCHVSLLRRCHRVLAVRGGEPCEGEGEGVRPGPGVVSVDDRDPSWDLAHAAALDVDGDRARCFLSECDIFGSAGGVGIAGRGHSEVALVDCTLTGAALRWSAIEISGHCSLDMKFVNMADLLGAGVMVLEHAVASIECCDIRRCGFAGILAGGAAAVTLVDTSVELTSSGTNVIACGDVQLRIARCTITALLPSAPLEMEREVAVFLNAIQQSPAAHIAALRKLFTMEHANLRAITAQHGRSCRPAPRHPGPTQRLGDGSDEAATGACDGEEEDEVKWPLGAQSVLALDRSTVVLENCELLCNVGDTNMDTSTAEGGAGGEGSGGPGTADAEDDVVSTEDSTPGEILVDGEDDNEDDDDDDDGQPLPRQSTRPRGASGRVRLPSVPVVAEAIFLQHIRSRAALGHFLRLSRRAPLPRGVPDGAVTGPGTEKEVERWSTRALRRFCMEQLPLSLSASIEWGMGRVVGSDTVRDGGGSGATGRLNEVWNPVVVRLDPAREALLAMRSIMLAMGAHPALVDKGTYHVVLRDTASVTLLDNVVSLFSTYSPSAVSRVAVAGLTTAGLPGGASASATGATAAAAGGPSPFLITPASPLHPCAELPVCEEAYPCAAVVADLLPFSSTNDGSMGWVPGGGPAPASPTPPPLRASPHATPALNLCTLASGDAAVGWGGPPGGDLGPLSGVRLCTRANVFRYEPVELGEMPSSGSGSLTSNPNASLRSPGGTSGRRPQTAAGPSPVINASAFGLVIATPAPALTPSLFPTHAVGHGAADAVEAAARRMEQEWIWGYPGGGGEGFDYKVLPRSPHEGEGGEGGEAWEASRDPRNTFVNVRDPSTVLLTVAQPQVCTRLAIFAAMNGSLEAVAALYGRSEVPIAALPPAPTPTPASTAAVVATASGEEGLSLPTGAALHPDDPRPGGEAGGTLVPAGPDGATAPSPTPACDSAAMWEEARVGVGGPELGVSALTDVDGNVSSAVICDAPPQVRKAVLRHQSGLPGAGTVSTEGSSPGEAGEGVGAAAREAVAGLGADTGGAEGGRSPRVTSSSLTVAPSPGSASPSHTAALPRAVGEVAVTLATTPAPTTTTTTTTAAAPTPAGAVFPSSAGSSLDEDAEWERVESPISSVAMSRTVRDTSHGSSSTPQLPASWKYVPGASLAGILAAFSSPPTPALGGGQAVPRPPTCGAATSPLLGELTPPSSGPLAVGTPAPAAAPSSSPAAACAGQGVDGGVSGEPTDLADTRAGVAETVPEKEAATAVMAAPSTGPGAAGEHRRGPPSHVPPSLHSDDNVDEDVPLPSPPECTRAPGSAPRNGDSRSLTPTSVRGSSPADARWVSSGGSSDGGLAGGKSSVPDPATPPPNEDGVAGSDRASQGTSTPTQMSVVLSRLLRPGLGPGGGAAAPALTSAEEQAARHGFATVEVVTPLDGHGGPHRGPAWGGGGSGEGTRGSLRTEPATPPTELCTPGGATQDRLAVLEEELAQLRSVVVSQQALLAQQQQEQRRWQGSAWAGTQHENPPSSPPPHGSMHGEDSSSNAPLALAARGATQRPDRRRPPGAVVRAKELPSTALAGEPGDGADLEEGVERRLRLRAREEEEGEEEDEVGGHGGVVTATPLPHGQKATSRRASTSRSSSSSSSEDASGGGGQLGTERESPVPPSSAGELPSSIRPESEGEPEEHVLPHTAGPSPQSRPITASATPDPRPPRGSAHRGSGGEGSVESPGEPTLAAEKLLLAQRRRSPWGEAGAAPAPTWPSPSPAPAGMPPSSRSTPPVPPPRGEVVRRPPSLVRAGAAGGGTPPLPAASPLSPHARRSSGRADAQTQTAPPAARPSAVASSTPRWASPSLGRRSTVGVLGVAPRLHPAGSIGSVLRAAAPPTRASVPFTDEVDEAAAEAEAAARRWRLRVMRELLRANLGALGPATEALWAQQQQQQQLSMQAMRQQEVRRRTLPSAVGQGGYPRGSGRTAAARRASAPAGAAGFVRWDEGGWPSMPPSPYRPPSAGSSAWCGGRRSVSRPASASYYGLAARPSPSPPPLPQSYVPWAHRDGPPAPARSPDGGYNPHLFRHPEPAGVVSDGEGDGESPSRVSRRARRPEPPGPAPRVAPARRSATAAAGLESSLASSLPASGLPAALDTTASPPRGVHHHHYWEAEGGGGPGDEDVGEDRCYACGAYETVGLAGHGGAGEGLPPTRAPLAGYPAYLAYLAYGHGPGGGLVYPQPPPPHPHPTRPTSSRPQPHRHAPPTGGPSPRPVSPYAYDEPSPPHLHASTAWDEVLARYLAEAHAQRRLTPRQLRAQVHRLYTRPMLVQAQRERRGSPAREAAALPQRRRSSHRSRSRSRSGSRHRSAAARAAGPPRARTASTVVAAPTAAEAAEVAGGAAAMAGEVTAARTRKGAARPSPARTPAATVEEPPPTVDRWSPRELSGPPLAAAPLPPPPSPDEGGPRRVRVHAPLHAAALPPPTRSDSPSLISSSPLSACGQPGGEASPSPARPTREAARMPPRMAVEMLRVAAQASAAGIIPGAGGNRAGSPGGRRRIIMSGLSP